MKAMFLGLVCSLLSMQAFAQSAPGDRMVCLTVDELTKYTQAQMEREHSIDVMQDAKDIFTKIQDQATPPAPVKTAKPKVLEK
jgi:hypothetical protein